MLAEFVPADAVTELEEISLQVGFMDSLVRLVCRFSIVRAFLRHFLLVAHDCVVSITVLLLSFHCVEYAEILMACAPWG